MPQSNPVPADEAFVITVGVPHANRNVFCSRALRVLRQYGFRAAPTSDDAILALADQVQLVQQLKENDPQ